MSAISVIEDDSLTRLSIEMALLDEGFSVRAFSTAREFLDAGEMEDIGCILTDIEMPGGVTGLDLLAEMGKSAPECPAVVMTAKGEGAFRKAALALGARAYLQKPFSKRTLLDAISGAMGPATGIVAAE
jgi:FixJ family two-component response regulator